LKRGEVWWAELPAPANRRPVVLLSRDEAYYVRELVTVAPVTTRIRDIASEVPLGEPEGLSKKCVVHLDTMTTIPKRLLTERISTLSEEKIADIEAAIHFSLGMREPS
jgi:mRNA interferase MazF